MRQRAARAVHACCFLPVRSASTSELRRIHATALHPHDAADFTLFPFLVLAEAVAGTVRGCVSVPS